MRRRRKSKFRVSLAEIVSMEYSVEEITDTSADEQPTAGSADDEIGQRPGPPSPQTPNEPNQAEPSDTAEESTPTETPSATEASSPNEVFEADLFERLAGLGL